jgi:hypothetical protein
MVDLFGNIFDEVYSIVQSWQPRKEYPVEEGYRDDLLQFLRRELNKPDWLGMSRQHSIQKESGRHLADIGIDRRVGIELKRNLKSKADADRLIGQVKGYLREYYEGVIIVLCGRTDRDKLEYLRDLLSEYSQLTLLGGKLVKIIIKTFKPTLKKHTKSIFDIEIPDII